MKKLPAPRIRSILCDLIAGGHFRPLGAKHGVAKTTIGNIAEAFNSHSLTVERVYAMTDAEIMQRMYPAKGSRGQDPNWDDIHAKLAKRHVTLVLLHSEYEQVLKGQGKAYSLSSFCRRYSLWCDTNNITPAGGNIDRIPGERIEIDFVGDKLEWVDPYGEIHSAKLFVACLPYSNMVFCEAFNDERQSSWITGVVDALEYFGGVPQVLVMDNAKALVSRADWNDPQINVAVQSLCNYYGMEPWACRPATPKQKNRVEAAVLIVERKVIAELTLNGRVLAPDLNAVNDLIKVKVDLFNRQPFSGNQSASSRWKRFVEDERTTLAALPRRRYENSEWKFLIADKAHCIRIASDGNQRYSVPPGYVRKRVAVRLCTDKLEIYDEETLKLIGTHARCLNKERAMTHLLPEHMTDAEKHYRRTPKEWVERFRNKGLPEDLAIKLVEYARTSKGNFPSGKALSAILRLFDNYPLEDLRNGIARSLECGVIKVDKIKIFTLQYQQARETNLSLDFDESEDSEFEPVMHSNIRNDYK